MIKWSVSAAILMLPLSAGPCLSDGTQRDGKLISEIAVRTASAELYSEILIRACRNGWRYPRSRIEKGFKRHLEELNLQLIDQGYTIVANNSPLSLSETAFVVKRPALGSRQFGCSRPYWLDE